MECLGHLQSKPEVWNWRDVEREFYVQAGCEKVHLGILPKCGNLFVETGTICGDRDHSVDWIWFLLERLSTITLSDPRMCRALSVTLFRLHHVRILHIRAQSSADRVPPCLLMYATTEVLSEAMRT